MSGDSQSPLAMSSPASAGSPGGPVALAPRAASVASAHDAASPAGVVTHKEWIIPPRPKPGRKPATDTPPTKRKAQNRAAQRAFRERRAARVNELEDKLKEVESENAARLQDYVDQVQQLATNNAELAKEHSRVKTRLECVQKELDLLRRFKAEQHEQRRQQQQEQAPPSTFQTQVASPAPSSGHETPTCGGSCACAEADKPLCAKPPAPSVPLRRRSARNRPPDLYRPSSPDPLGCGGCSKDGACACITEAAASAAMYSAQSLLQKRPTSPSSNTPKRTRIAFVDLTPPEELETDFTTAYMTKPPPAPAFSASTGSLARMPDPCGFCSDGTHCVCAEAAAAAGGPMLMVDDSDSEEHHSTKLPPLLSNHTPPPADNNALERPMVLHPPMSTKSSAAQVPRPSGCQPGGCKQCQDDPMSTLFCQSVATKVGRPGGCCGGGCCGESKKTPSSRPSPAPRETQDANGTEDKGTFIPASAAYQALSRHRGFEQATADLGSLVRPLMVKQADGRCPMVEVSSVRDVLKQLDRRFGSDAN